MMPTRQATFPSRGIHLQIEAPEASTSGKDVTGVWFSLTDREALAVMDLAAQSRPRENAPAHLVSFWGGRRLDGYWSVSRTTARTIRAKLERWRKGTG